MLPIKGRYLISKDKRFRDHLKMLVYPVPKKSLISLGIHSTLTTDGRIKLGPTIFPAFGAENYDYF